MLSQGEAHPQHGTLVGPGVNAQHHQHMFLARIDPAIDDGQGGRDVVVTEVRREEAEGEAGQGRELVGGVCKRPLPSLFRNVRWCSMLSLYRRCSGIVQFALAQSGTVQHVVKKSSCAHHPRSDL